MFDHERLDVYKVSIEFVLLVDEVIEHLPRGKNYLVDQLQRASSSVPLNIAEGAGEYSSNEKCRFYRMAKRSATECSAIFDVCQCLKLVEEQRYFKARQLLLRIVSMLVIMAQVANNSGTGTHTGTGTIR
jgi:four helix bundle protein